MKSAEDVCPLPAFPVDEDTLVQLELSMEPNAWGGTSRLQGFLESMTRDALQTQEPSPWAYSSPSVIRALVAEVRRLRMELE